MYFRASVIGVCVGGGEGGRGGGKGRSVSECMFVTFTPLPNVQRTLGL